MAKHEIPKLAAEMRNQTGSRPTTRLRESGQLPAVIYGHKQETIHVSVDAKEMLELLHRNTHVLEIVSESSAESCLIKQVQWDHLGAQIIHVDLARVDLTERVRTHVILELTGDPIGLKESGAFLEQHHPQIEVECQAAAIPDQLTADISELDAGKPLTAAELSLPDDIGCTLPPETILASISTSVEEPDDAESVEAEAAENEPEVIGAKQDEPEEQEQA